MNKTIGIILAAGFSRRMKKDKLLLKYNEKTFLEIIVEKLLKLKLRKIILVVPEKASLEEYLNSLKYYPTIIIVYNKNPELGITSSIKKALEKVVNFRIDFDSLMFFMVDQPFLSENTIRKIINSKKENCIIVPRINETAYNPVLFSKKFLKNFFELEGDIGGKQIIKENKDSVIYINFEEEEEFQDIDTPEDFSKIK